MTLCDISSQMQVYPTKQTLPATLWSPFMISHWYLWQEQHFKHLQTMGPYGPCLFYDSNCQKTPHDTQFMQHYDQPLVSVRRAFWVYTRNGPKWPLYDLWTQLTEIYPHGQLLKEHYDQLWPSLIDICRMRSISCIFQRMGPNGPYMTFDLKSLNTPYDPLIEDP